MCPHFVHSYGGFKVQGRSAEDALKIIDNARAIEEAGACGFEIEAVPAPVGKRVNDAVEVFTFSIGAGPAACGQLLLGADLLGSFDQFKPKFTKRFANLAQAGIAGFEQYAREVRDGTFPDDEHGYTMQAEELTRLDEMLSPSLERRQDG
jgi:3-methyl-2-oxobutanoate hydroxymethyltransferase